MDDNKHDKDNYGDDFETDDKQDDATDDKQDDEEYGDDYDEGDDNTKETYANLELSMLEPELYCDQCDLPTTRASFCQQCDMTYCWKCDYSYHKRSDSMNHERHGKGPHAEQYETYIKNMIKEASHFSDEDPFLEQSMVLFPEEEESKKAASPKKAAKAKDSAGKATEEDKETTEGDKETSDHYSSDEDAAGDKGKEKGESGLGEGESGEGGDSTKTQSPVSVVKGQEEWDRADEGVALVVTHDDVADDPSKRQGSYYFGRFRIPYIIPKDFDPESKDLGTLPACRLQLSHLYGYQCGNNLFYLSNRLVVYPCGSVAVVAHVAEGKQRFFCEHSGAITSLAVHPQRQYVATGACGQPDQPASLIVWDARKLKRVQSLSFHEHSVSALAFSADGNWLVSVGCDEMRTLAIWDWRASELVAQATTGQLPVLSIQCCPRTTSEDEMVFATASAKEIRLWTWKQKYGLSSVVVHIDGAIIERGIRQMADEFEAEPNFKRIMKGVVKKSGEYECLAFLTGLQYSDNDDPEFVIGCASGLLLHIQGSRLVRARAAHAGAMSAVRAIAGGFLTAGCDGRIVLWTNYFDQKAEVDSNSCLSAVLSTVVKGQVTGEGGQGIYGLDYSDGQAMVGTDGNMVLQVDLMSHDSRVLTSSLAKSPSSVSVHPRLPVFLTAGAITGSKRGIVQLINYNTRRAFCPHDGDHGDGGEEGDGQTLHTRGSRRAGRAVFTVEAPVRAASFSIDGNIIVCGMANGKLAVVDFRTCHVIARVRLPPKPIVHIVFSVHPSEYHPDSGLLAVCQDVSVYVFRFDRTTALLKPLFQLKGRDRMQYATFSLHSKTLLTCDSAFNQHIWSMKDGTRVDFSEIGAYKWPQRNWPVGWGMQGILEDGAQRGNPASAQRGNQVNDVLNGKALVSDALASGRPRVVVCRSNEGNVLAFGDNKGTVKLFRYPACSPKAVGRAVPSCLAPITHMSFTPQDTYVVGTSATSHISLSDYDKDNCHTYGRRWFAVNTLPSITCQWRQRDSNQEDELDLEEALDSNEGDSRGDDWEKALDAEFTKISKGIDKQKKKEEEDAEKAKSEAKSDEESVSSSRPRRKRIPADLERFFIQSILLKETRLVRRDITLLKDKRTNLKTIILSKTKRAKDLRSQLEQLGGEPGACTEDLDGVENSSKKRDVMEWYTSDLFPPGDEDEDEIDHETKALRVACQKLADANIPLRAEVEELADQLEELEDEATAISENLRRMSGVQQTRIELRRSLIAQKGQQEKILVRYRVQEREVDHALQRVKESITKKQDTSASLLSEVKEKRATLADLEHKYKSHLKDLREVVTADIHD